MPAGTLKVFGQHGEVGNALAADGGHAEAVLAEFGAATIDIEALASRLQDEGVRSFIASWDDLLSCIARKRDRSGCRLSIAEMAPSRALEQPCRGT